MMKKVLLIILMFISCKIFCQQKITGKVSDENANALNAVLVINMSKNIKTYTDSSGGFVLEAGENDQIRFVKDMYHRVDEKVGKESVFNIILTKEEIVIPEVEITYKLTGNLEKDSKHFEPSKKVLALNSDMKTYMKTSMNEVTGKLQTPSDFKGHDFSTGQVDLIKMAKFGVALAKKPQIATRNYYETKTFINKIKMEINLDFLKENGMNDEAIEDFLVYANEIRSLARKYAGNFNADKITSDLKIAFVEYGKTHNTGK